MSQLTVNDPPVSPDVGFLCLGSGTSHGVPMIGCTCAVCRSDDPRNTRTRCSALLTVCGLNILIDTSTDLRLQALRHGIDRVDAVLYTHGHADHLHGIDDLRSFTLRQRVSIPCFGGGRTLDLIRQRYPYIFKDPEFRLKWSIPRIDLHEVSGPFGIRGIRVTPVPVLHGRLPVLGFRIGRFAYLTDCSEIPDASYDLLGDLDTLIIDGLRQRPHPTHFSIDQAVAEIRRISPRRACLTHLTHDVDHQTVNETLPESVQLAYDGLRLAVPGT